MSVDRWQLDSPPDLICWDCGARNAAGTSECWLCQRRDWNRGRRRSRARSLRPRMTIAGLMTVVAVIAVFCWLFVTAPPIAAGLMLSLAPGVIVTEVQARIRARRADPMYADERFLRIIAITIVVPFLVSFALVVWVLLGSLFGG